MFDIGFSELLMIGLVALLVIGPDRLPGAARTAGLLFGRFKRGFTSIREEVEREIGMDDIRRDLRNEDILAKERKMLEEASEGAKEITEYANRMARDTEARLKQSLQPYSPDKIVKDRDPDAGKLESPTTATGTDSNAEVTEQAEARTENDSNSNSQDSAEK